MNNAELFKKVFGIYAEEFWSYTEKQMLDWINADVPERNVGDMISRQTAIDALHTQFRDGFDGDKWWNSTHVLAAIEGVPSAVPRWIPVTERLPEIDMTFPHSERYLVQYEDGDMDVASWSNVNWFWTDHVTEPHWNCVQFQTVTAWMPLPEPWKGEADV